MVQEVKIKGFEAFQEFVEKLNDKDIVNFYFTGDKDESGKSWCPDCVVAAPIVQKSLQNAPKQSTFVQVEVGEKDSWKDRKNPFRTSTHSRLMVIPTLLRWNSYQRLEGPQCEKEDLLKMFFTDE